MNCPHAGICGGCSLLPLPYAEQLTRKEAALARLLPDAALRGSGWGVASPFLPVADDPSHFRQKVAFVFAQTPDGRSLVMGHFERGSQRVVPVTSCPVHSVRGNRIAFALRDHLAGHGVTAAGAALNGLLRHLIVRTTADDREAVAMLVVTRNDKSLRKPIRALLDSPERPDGFFINIHDRPGPFMVGDRTIKIDGHSHVRERIGGVSFLVSPTAFFQTNAAAAGVLQDFVVRSVRGATRVLDLYCGSGLFSLPLVAEGARVTGVEENRQAIHDAEANARINRTPSSRVRFIAARVEDALPLVQRDAWDALILDPPRQGCSHAVLESVFQEMRPQRVTYVSCNPEALADELPGIVSCGYRVDELRAVDMFPHTEHIEVIARLSRPAN
jgi:23S rRNA (uracil1939-C5)-methyltransferase